MALTECPKCKTALEARPGTMFWRGAYFAGLVCPKCNGIWAPDAFWSAVIASAWSEKQAEIQPKPVPLAELNAEPKKPNPADYL